MFGTIARLKVKPGEEAAVRAWGERWWRERAPSVPGAITSYLCKPVNGAPDEWVLLAVFDSKDHYYANASDPEQDRWYRDFRAHLQADPEWTDVEIEQTQPPGR